MESNKKLKEEVIKAADSLRKKFKSLSRETSDTEMLLAKLNEPLSEPLKEIRDVMKVKTEKPGKKEEEEETASHSLKFKRENKKGEKVTLLTSKRARPASREKEDDKRPRLTSPTAAASASIDYQQLIDEYLSRPKTELDRRYGINVSGSNGRMTMGDSEVVLKDGFFIIKDKLFKATPGLCELLFLKQPSSHTEEDSLTYKDILVLTNAHRQSYSSEKNISSSKGIKYTKVISPLFDKKRGSGFMRTDLPVYEYYNDPNDLVDRLRLLIASRDSGNNSHENEIESLIEELRLKGFIY